jgi:thiol:disulfide interchange protein DsbC
MTFSKRILAISLVTGLILNLTLSSAFADEASDIAAIKDNLSKRKPAISAKSVKLSPLPGLYEVYANNNIYYVDKLVKYVMVGGSIIEDATQKNLTVERLKDLTRIDFNKLPFQDAIEIKKGTGAYKFAIFSDPDCPFCKSVELGLDELKATDYTAYVFLLPLKELHPDAVKKSENIWCAKDKSEAWLNLMVKGTEPEKATCENPIGKIEKLANELGVSGTPTIYLNDGNFTQDPKELLSAITGKKVTIVR